MINFKHLEVIRLFEFKLICSFFVPGKCVLEIGAGNGWQSKLIAERGSETHAIDVESSCYKKDVVFPIIFYDGKNIPFPDGYFDVVFSSNVLEHISHVDSFQEEICRVLKADGLIVHVLPTSSWIFWATFCNYIRSYLLLMKFIFNKIFQKRSSNNSEMLSQFENKLNQKGKSVFKSLIPKRHGERGTYFTEYYLFSSYAWKKIFKKHFDFVSVTNTGLYYSACGLIGESPSVMSFRKKLSKIMGSSCKIYVMKKYGNRII